MDLYVKFLQTWKVTENCVYKRNSWHLHVSGVDANVGNRFNATRCVGMGGLELHGPQGIRGRGWRQHIC